MADLPKALAPQTTHEGWKIRALPYMKDPMQRDWAPLISGLTLGSSAMFFVGGLIGAAVLVVGSIVGGSISAVKVLDRSRKVNCVLEVELFSHRIEARMRNGSTQSWKEQVPLVDIGRCTVAEPAYQCWEVHVQRPGKPALVLPMHRELKEHAEWLATTLAEAGKQARARQGGANAVPDALSKLKRR